MGNHTLKTERHLDKSRLAVAVDRRQVDSVVQDLHMQSAGPAPVLGRRDRRLRCPVVELALRDRLPVVARPVPALWGSYRLPGLAGGIPNQPLTGKMRALLPIATLPIKPIPRGI